MKTSRLLLCWICAAALAAGLPLWAADNLPRAGQDAPLFAGQDQDGNRWKLADHIGQHMVFLYFYPNDGSAEGIAEACSLRDNSFELKQAGVEVVGVSFDGTDTHKNFVFKYNLDFPLLADPSGAIADAYGARMGEHYEMGSPAFAMEDIKDLPGLIKRWKARSDPASAFLWKSLSKPEQSLLKNYEPSGPDMKQAQEVVLQALNKAIGGPRIYKDKRLKGVLLRPGTIDLIKQKPTGHNLALLNRLLLEDAYPLELSRSQNMDRCVSFLIGLDGKIIHVTDSPDPAAHVKALMAAVAKLRVK